MGYIKSALFISLDGVVEAPNTWHFPYFNDEMGGSRRGPDGRQRRHADRAPDLRRIRQLLAVR
jgi:hypothetical protein